MATAGGVRDFATVLSLSSGAVSRATFGFAAQRVYVRNQGAISVYLTLSSGDPTTNSHVVESSGVREFEWTHTGMLAAMTTATSGIQSVHVHAVGSQWLPS
jgi:anti-sigma factor RsiW